MRKVTVRYTVEFEATLEVADDATPRDIGEELTNVNIPEDDISKYVEDTFSPLVLNCEDSPNHGDPIIFSDVNEEQDAKDRDYGGRISID